MARSTAREAAMQMVYERMMGGEGGEPTRAGLLELSLSADDEAYLSDVLGGVFAHQAEIDAQIERYAKGWTLARMARVDLAILRLAAYEMLYRDDIPDAASINEAVELSRRYSTDEAGGFVNGVLGSVARAREPAK